MQITDIIIIRYGHLATMISVLHEGQDTILRKGTICPEKQIRSFQLNVYLHSGQSQSDLNFISLPHNYIILWNVLVLIFKLLIEI